MCQQPIMVQGCPWAWYGSAPGKASIPPLVATESFSRKTLGSREQDEAMVARTNKAWHGILAQELLHVPLFHWHWHGCAASMDSKNDETQKIKVTSKGHSRFSLSILPEMCIFIRWRGSQICNKFMQLFSWGKKRKKKPPIIELLCYFNFLFIFHPKLMFSLEESLSLKQKAIQQRLLTRWNIFTLDEWSICFIRVIRYVWGFLSGSFFFFLFLLLLFQWWWGVYFPFWIEQKRKRHPFPSALWGILSYRTANSVCSQL